MRKLCIGRQLSIDTNDHFGSGRDIRRLFAEPLLGKGGSSCPSTQQLAVGDHSVRSIIKCRLAEATLNVCRVWWRVLGRVQLEMHMYAFMIQLVPDADFSELYRNIRNKSADLQPRTR